MYRFIQHGRVATLALSIAAALPAHAQLTVGAGSAIYLGNGTLNAGCQSLGVDGRLNIDAGAATGLLHLQVGGSGQLDGGSGTISLSGDYTRAGSFTPGSGLFQSVDGCGATASRFMGDNSFARLTVSTSTGRLWQLPAGSTQSIAQALALTGAAGQLLQIRSSAAGSAANLNLAPGASQLISYVNVQDNHATGQGLAPGAAASFHSVQGSNTQHWFVATDTPGEGSAARPVPIGPLAPWLSLALLAAWGVLRRRGA